MLVAASSSMQSSPPTNTYPQQQQPTSDATLSPSVGTIRPPSFNKFMLGRGPSTTTTTIYAPEEDAPQPTPRQPLTANPWTSTSVQPPTPTPAQSLETQSPPALAAPTPAPAAIIQIPATTTALLTADPSPSPAHSPSPVSLQTEQPIQPAAKVLRRRVKKPDPAEDWMAKWTDSAPSSSAPRPASLRTAGTRPSSPMPSSEPIAERRRLTSDGEVSSRKASSTGSGASSEGTTGTRSNRQAGGSAMKSNAMSLTPHVEPHVFEHAGRWYMEGFEKDVGGLELAVPLLQLRLRSGVQAEREAEQLAVTLLYSGVSLLSQQRDGLVLVGLSGKPTGQLFRSVIWTMAATQARAKKSDLAVSSAAGGRSGTTALRSTIPGSASAAFELPYHRFRKGDAVMLSPDDPVLMAAAAVAVAAQKIYDDEGGHSRTRVSRTGKPHTDGASSDSGSSSDGRSSSRGARSGAETASDESDGPPDLVTFEGTVLETSKGHLSIAMDRSVSDDMLTISERLGAGLRWRVDASIQDTTTKRQLEAIGNLGKLQDPDSPTELLMRAIIVGSRSAPKLAEQLPLWAMEEPWRLHARQELIADTNLNDSQRRAIALALTRTFTLWQGPPGTGKTRTLLSLIRVLVRTNARFPKSAGLMQAILACGDTNAAVDNLVEGLHERGIRVIRVGPPAKVRENLRHLTLDAQTEASSEGKAAVARRERSQRQLDNYMEMLSRGQMKETRESRELLGTMREEAVQARKQCDNSLQEVAQGLLNRAQVVCSTCTGAGDYALKNRLYRMVVIDESTQATEPAVLVPLTRGAQCCIMAGDPKQLPPTIMSAKASTFSLDVTLFDRMSDNGLSPMLLDTQYRMHPAISAFPSFWFYKARLRNGVTAAEKPIPLGFTWPKPNIPVAVVEVEYGFEQSASSSGVGSAKEKISGGSGSFRNTAEAEVAFRIAVDMLAAGDVASVTILSPYRGQVRTLEALIRAHPTLPPTQTLIASSVDGYQGREADVVVFTTVRNNPRGAIGFVSDPRRLNVAITRPRRGLVVVTSPSTLRTKSKDWAAFFKWTDQEGVVMDAANLPKQRLQPTPKFENPSPPTSSVATETRDPITVRKSLVRIKPSSQR